METLGLILGNSFASGLNLYAAVATLGLLHRCDVVRLPQSLEIVSNPWVLGLALFLFVIEFVADKIPFVDSIWDVIHTFIRPPAAAVLAFGAAYGTVDVAWAVAAALLGGGVALTSHSAKATTRAAINTSPEPFSNWAASVFEDILAIFLVWVASHPYITTAIVLVLIVVSVFVVVKLLKFFVNIFRKVYRWIFRRSTAPRPSSS